MPNHHNISVSLDGQDARAEATLLRAIERYAETAATTFALLSEACESPIERQFLAGLMAASMTYGDVIEFREGGLDAGPPPGKRPCCFAQQNIQTYRVDFLLATDSLRVVIECDGHDFHERTKEQAARDRKRDRALTMSGYTVLRFTGSEIYAGAEECGFQAMKAVW